MEKVLKRAAQKAKQAQKSLAKRQKYLKNDQEREIRINRQQNRKYITSLYQDEQKRRRDQWTRGPLAAKHDIGPDAKYYGTFDANHMAFQKEFDARKPEWIHIAEGDRVVVTKGPDAGKIAPVISVDKGTCAVRVRGLNKFEIKVPEQLKENTGGQDLVALEREISLDDVKLVYPLPDPMTGEPKDTIIEKMDQIGRVWNRHKREWSDGERVVSGTNTILPWPEKTEPEESDYDADTASDLVEQVTFRAHLLTAPMPTKVMDELRNPYSRFRTRHTREFVQRTEEKVAREEKRKDLIKTMQTPLQRIAEMRAQLKKETKRDLSDSQIDLIREVMARGSSNARLAAGP